MKLPADAHPWQLAGMPTLEFTADWRVKAPPRLFCGEPVQVVYAPERLPQCRGSEGGKPRWTIVMFWQLNGGRVRNAWVGGAAPTPNMSAQFTPSEPGALAVWFEVSNVWGCSAWDSDFGKNFHFTVSAAR